MSFAQGAGLLNIRLELSSLIPNQNLYMSYERSGCWGQQPIDPNTIQWSWSLGTPKVGQLGCESSGDIVVTQRAVERILVRYKGDRNIVAAARMNGGLDSPDSTLSDASSRNVNACRAN